MRRQSVSGRHHLPDEVLLVVTQFDLRVHARKLLMRPIVLHLDDVVEVVVVVPVQPLAAFVVLPDPILERLLHLLHLGVRVVGRLHVDGRLAALFHGRIVHGDRLTIQRRL